MAIQKPGAKPAAATKPVGVGLSPESFVQGGGLHSDFDGEILDAIFCEFDYGGAGPVVLALALEIRNNEVEEDPNATVPNPFIQYYSAGDLTQFVPSDDGREAVPVGSKTGLSKSSNAFAVLTSMYAAGMPVDYLSNRVDVLIGVTGHWKREEQPDRKGLKDKKTKDDGRKPEILLMESGWTAPGQTKTVAAKPGPAAAGPRAVAAGPKPGPAAATPPPPPAATAGVLPDEVTQANCQTYIIGLLMDNGGTHPKAGLHAGVIKYAAANGIDTASRNKMIKALGNEAFLATGNNNPEMGWTFDGQTLTATE